MRRGVDEQEKKDMAAVEEATAAGACNGREMRVSCIKKLTRRH